MRSLLAALNLRKRLFVVSGLRPQEAHEIKGVASGLRVAGFLHARLRLFGNEIERRGLCRPGDRSFYQEIVPDSDSPRRRKQPVL
jgi:hypothetical protein